MLPDQPIICENLSTGAVRYQWNFGDICGDTTCLSYDFAPAHFYTETTNETPYCVTLKVWSDKDCYDFNYDCNYMVTVIPEGQLIFPNVFAPNPYGSNGGVETLGELNTVFIPKVKIEISEDDYSLQIYNKQGVLIYESTNVNIGWDGYINGKMSPMGAYIYKATGKFSNGQPFSYQGSFMLIK